MIPKHIEWYIDGVKYAGFTDNPEHKFEFKYVGLYDSYNPTVTYKQAIRNKLATLADKPLAICVSGRDSEIIAKEAHDMGLSFELFFLDLWSLNRYVYDLSSELAQSLNAKLNVISVTKDDAYAWAEYWFKKSRVNKPTYLLLPLLLDKIPLDHHIIVGEGDLNKGGASYQDEAILAAADDGVVMLNTEISYWLWGMENNRPGDYYFHSSTPELITSVWNNELLYKSYPNIDNRKIITNLWGELIFKEKTTNWDTEAGVAENFSLRKHLKTKYQIKHNVYYDVVRVVNGNLV